ncbi:syntaxin, putative [Eimeria necatrix]|uniref:Syntaxin, putative n=1 Tax=Eimeria necatrix TaxID=51315 RepID=U6MXH9_9EIME|nr:syntaxin, putative [Eimeria necatrix]CDJ67728.1 syntaxin, putative [Eimeria necatrix]
MKRKGAGNTPALVNSLLTSLCNISPFFRGAGNTPALVNSLLTSLCNISPFFRGLGADVSHELHKVMAAAMTLMQKSKRAIEGLGFENTKLADNEKGFCASELRIRKNLQQTLAAQLQQQLQLLQLRQAEYRLQVRKKAVRQVKLVYPEVPEEEVETLVDSGELTAMTAIKMRVSGVHAPSPAKCDRRHSRQRMFWITVILIIIAAIVLVPVFVTLLK